MGPGDKARELTKRTWVSRKLASIPSVTTEVANWEVEGWDMSDMTNTAVANVATEIASPTPPCSGGLENLRTCSLSIMFQRSAVDPDGQSSLRNPVILRMREALLTGWNESRSLRCASCRSPLHPLNTGFACLPTLRYRSETASQVSVRHFLRRFSRSTTQLLALSNSFLKDY